MWLIKVTPNLAASVCMCMYLCVYMCMHSGMYVCVYCMYIHCMCMGVYLYVYVYMYIFCLWLFLNWNCKAGSGRCGLLHWNYIQHWILLNVIPMGRAVVAGASGICVMVLICMYCVCTCICIYLCVSMYIYIYILYMYYVFVYHVRGRNGGKLRKKKFCLPLVCRLRLHVFLYPRSPKGEGGILFYLCPSFCLSVCPRYFSSHFSQ